MGDSWSSVIARTAMNDKPTMAAFYFVSYVVIVAIITMNVVQAVFIDSYLSAHDDAEEKTEKQMMHDLFNALDRNKDGTVSKNEVELVCEVLSTESRDYRADEFFKLLDKEHNCVM